MGSGDDIVGEVSLNWWVWFVPDFVHQKNEWYAGDPVERLKKFEIFSKADELTFVWA